MAATWGGRVGGGGSATTCAGVMVGTGTITGEGTRKLASRRIGIGSAGAATSLNSSSCAYAWVKSVDEHKLQIAIRLRMANPPWRLRKGGRAPRFGNPRAARAR